MTRSPNILLDAARLVSELARPIIDCIRDVFEGTPPGAPDADEPEADEPDEEEPTHG